MLDFPTVLGGGDLYEVTLIHSDPVHFLDDEANPLRKWLLSAMVDQHIIQVLELAAVRRESEWARRTLTTPNGPA